ncbi:MAG: hypothetical protein Q8L14_30210, partial [Myxococcales bacterium]|nr:hypothetical protein [Myxococcales bacterium]
NAAGGNAAGGNAAGGNAAGGNAAGGNAAGGNAAGGNAGGGNAAGGNAAGGNAGGPASDGGVTFCDEMGSGANHLRAVLMECPGGGDSNIYGFNATRCAMLASTNCTPTEQQTLRGVVTCQKAIVFCASPADRSRAATAIDACVVNLNVSSLCIGSLQ